MNQEDIEGIYEQLDTPYKRVTIDGSRIFVKGRVSPEQRSVLASCEIEDKGNQSYAAHVKLGVFQKSENAKTLDNQLLIGTMEARDADGDLYVYDAYNGFIVKNLHEDELDKVSDKRDPYFLQLACNLGVESTIVKYRLSRDDIKIPIRVEEKGLVKLPQPQELEFGINNEASIKIGDLEAIFFIDIINGYSAGVYHPQN